MIYLVFVSSLSVKLRELNFSLFVYFVGKACLFFNFCMMEFTTMFCLTWLWIIQKLKNKHTFPKKYINWAKLRNLNLTEWEETKIRYIAPNLVYNVTTIFIQNGHKLLFWVKKIVILRIYSALRAWDNSNDSGAKSWKVEDILTISVEVNHAGDIFEGTQQDIIGAFYLHLF